MLEPSSSEREVVFLKQRKGFIKLAIRMGLDLVPIFGFGENDVSFLISGILFLYFFLRHLFAMIQERSLDPFYQESLD
jgi:hypothetical protein